MGQPIFAETSSPDVRWMLPGTVLPRYGESTDKSFQLIEESQRVRPTSGLEFVSSRHFPDEVQGNFLINNTIGFLGMKMHTLKDQGTGFKSNFVMDTDAGRPRRQWACHVRYPRMRSRIVCGWYPCFANGIATGREKRLFVNNQIVFRLT